MSIASIQPPRTIRSTGDREALFAIFCGGVRCLVWLFGAFVEVIIAPYAYQYKYSGWPCALFYITCALPEAALLWLLIAARHTNEPDIPAAIDRQARMVPKKWRFMCAVVYFCSTVQIYVLVALITRSVLYNLQLGAGDRNLITFVVEFTLSYSSNLGVLLTLAVIGVPSYVTLPLFSRRHLIDLIFAAAVAGCISRIAS